MAGLRQDGQTTANGGISTPPPAVAARTMSNISFPDGEQRLGMLQQHCASSFYCMPRYLQGSIYRQ